MSAGGSKGGPTSEINMTPMIDVLLVLLIIFMVVQQGLQRGIAVQIPPLKDEAAAQPQTPDDSQIVLQIEPGPRYLVNSQPVSSNLAAELTRIFQGRNRKVIFVKGAENLTYSQVISAVDASRAAGIEVIGLVPRPEVGPATAVAAPAPAQ
jgi:biopolymer transport protein ExbD